MGRKKKFGVDILDIVADKLDDVDEETGKTYRELIALQIIKTAAGKEGSARESINAALSILDRLDRKSISTKDGYLKAAKDKNKILEKYKVNDGFKN